MTSFAPINDDHAVTSVLFGLQLDEFIEPPTIELIKRAMPWSDSLPAVSALPPVEINQGGQNFPMPAVQFAIVRPDSRPLWSVKFSGYDLIVECTVYSRWADVWNSASRYLSEAFELVRSKQTDVNIADFRLQVTDQFRTAEEGYKASELFAEGSRYLSPMAYDGRQVWNNAVGWIETEGDVRYSDTLAIQIQGNEDGSTVTPPYLVTIQHFGRAVTAGDPVPEIGRLDELITNLHERNKNVIGEILSAEMRQRIGLKL
ncbi:hypothetical protein RM53_04165 [Brevundimonas nasdae]|uniref:TIGR04255 family protein n=1 Tax=Brevundimonas nasdae TaxID=172043 RepID=A0A0B4CH64_9CAUL|nr:hypothetical protein [Brevundimonas nasdae]KIC60634.1 hypothetical protein RM53_04165 [Brevundimonas nasdae]